MLGHHREGHRMTSSNLHLNSRQLQSVAASWQGIAGDLRSAAAPPTSAGDWPNHQATAAMHGTVTTTGQGLGNRVAGTAYGLTASVAAFQQHDGSGANTVGGIG